MQATTPNILQGLNDVVVENPGGGVDTVRSTFSHTLEANVENLQLEGTQAIYGGGNNFDNIIWGGPGPNETLDGGAGNDVLVAGTGATNFVETKGNGSDVIYGFRLATDDVRLGGYAFSSFAQVQGALTQSGADTVLQLSSTESLTLRNTTASSLKASNFQFGLDMSQLKMSFDDEFNSLSASTGSATTWRTVYGNGGNGTLTNRAVAGDTELYVDPTYTGTLGTTALGLKPLSINNGVLTITAKPVTSAAMASELFNQSYTSGLLTTKGSFSQEYGYFDVRAKLPTGQGFLPAFWLLPTDPRRRRSTSWSSSARTPTPSTPPRTRARLGRLRPRARPSMSTMRARLPRLRHALDRRHPDLVCRWGRGRQ